MSAKVATAVWAALLAGLSGAAESVPLRIAVGDPLAVDNACTCVAGYAQRDYRVLAEALTRETGRPVKLAFADTLESASERLGGEPHLMIGKSSVVEAELTRSGRRDGKCLARLTDQRGDTVFQGVLVVRADDPAQKVADAAGYRIIFGPEKCEEKHGAALELMRTFGFCATGTLETADNCTLAARRVTEGGNGAAAFISDYAMPLLVGCGAVDKGGLRVIGRTGPRPFVAVYATGLLTDGESGTLQAALLRVGQSKRIRKALESRDGFVLPEALPVETGVPPVVLPDRLPEKATVRWRRALGAQSLGGLSGGGRYLIVSDKDEAAIFDVWRCLDAASGAPVWEIAYPAPGKMDYTGAPRATPVVVGRLVYLLGAFGDLVCGELATGKIAWRCNLVKRFGGKLPVWGFCGTPLVAGDLVVVQTAAPKAALVALDRMTGRERWRAAGDDPGYGSLIHAHLGGRWQIVGHEARSLCGWDPESGKRLWQVVPKEPHDFNVPTPSRVGDLLLAATENNGTRLYAFDGAGVIRPEPVFSSGALSPQIATPVRVGTRLWGQDGEGVHALALDRALRPAGVWADPAFKDHVSLVAGGSRVLAVAKTGDIFLFSADAAGAGVVKGANVFEKHPGGAATEVWSFPVVLNGCLYLRSQDEVVCLEL